MPLYDYRCPAGHITIRLRNYDERDAPVLCRECGVVTERLFPVPHVGPDGMYSYAPNLGSKDTFDRKWDLMEQRKRAKAEKEGR
jgi:putative FmdB family regulatory protein